MIAAAPSNGLVNNFESLIFSKGAVSPGMTAKGSSAIARAPGRP